MFRSTELNLKDIFQAQSTSVISFRDLHNLFIVCSIERIIIYMTAKNSTPSNIVKMHYGYNTHELLIKTMGT